MRNSTTCRMRLNNKHLSSCKSKAENYLSLLRCTMVTNTILENETDRKTSSQGDIALIWDDQGRAPASCPFAWRARSHSWIFIKCNATFVDCQTVAPSHVAILNLWKMYYLWALRRPPFHFLAKHTWENQESVCTYSQTDLESNYPVMAA